MYHTGRHQDLTPSFYCVEFTSLYGVPGSWLLAAWTSNIEVFNLLILTNVSPLFHLQYCTTAHILRLKCSNTT